MSYNNAISSSDPQAAAKLTEKLQSCEKLQETMKAVNAHWRKTGTCHGAPGITDAQAGKLGVLQ
jgi:formate dehydrogenase assembly factor FdhD